MRDSIDEIFSALATPFSVGQILVQKREGGFVLSHRDEESFEQLQRYRDPEDAAEIAKYDDAGDYRPLKTAPNLRHGWQLELATIEELRRALDYFYPARLAVFAASKNGHLKTTPLRDTLDRQSGLYRVAAKISDPQINGLVTDFCRSDGGCLRTILWKRDRNGVIASTELSREKFDPLSDQAIATCSRRAAGYEPASHSDAATVPLLCQEACNLLVAECRKVVKSESPAL